MVLATQFPSVYWNCACLIVNAQAIEETKEKDDDIVFEEEENSPEKENNEPEMDEDEDDNEEKTDKKQKKKVKNSDYGRIATAIGKMKNDGIEVSPPDINLSTFTFSPDETHNLIRYGLRGINKIGEDLVNEILANRPYNSIPDFLSKVKVSKPQMINLIKCGAFDGLGDRTKLMHEYIDIVCEAKKRITMQNFAMLIQFGLVPDEYDMQRRVFNFNKYLKKLKNNMVYELDQIAFNFFEKNFSLDALSQNENSESGFSINIQKWEKIYKAEMAKVKPWVVANAAELLVKVNERLTSDLWNKYCTGTLSKWEMDSVSYYSHAHELRGIDMSAYDVVNYFELPEQPVVKNVLRFKDKEIPIFELVRIAGTVLDKDKTKRTVTILTTSGVVTVKIYGAFANYDRQISEVGADGKKHVIRKSEFSRGNKIIVCGIRRDNMFYAKKYKATPWHEVDTIEEIRADGTLKITNRNDLGLMD